MTSTIAFEKSGQWKKDETFIIGLDTLCAGTLRYLEEGEMWAIAVPPKLLAALEATNAESELKATKYVIPSGASDSLPFLVRGWDTVCLSCIDPVIGAPRNYHSPSDTWKNIDERELESEGEHAGTEEGEGTGKDKKLMRRGRGRGQRRGEP
jgi:hypothetical protein